MAHGHSCKTNKLDPEELPRPIRGHAKFFIDIWEDFFQNPWRDANFLR